MNAPVKSVNAAADAEPSAAQNDNEAATPQPARRVIIRTIGWRGPDARISLAKAFGEIAADLWLAGKISLTGVPNVATLAASDAPHNESQDEHREAADRGGGPQALGRSGSR